MMTLETMPSWISIGVFTIVLVCLLVEIFRLRFSAKQETVLTDAVPEIQTPQVPRVKDTYTLTDGDPFSEVMPIEVMDIQQNLKGVTYIKYRYKTGSTSTCTLETFRDCYTLVSTYLEVTG